MQGAPLFLYQISQADPAYVSLTVLEGRQDLGRTYRPVRAIQCAHPQFCRSINSSPKSFFQWKRKVAAKPQTSAFERVQTLEPTKEIIENKHPSGISIIVPGFRENSGTVPGISTRHEKPTCGEDQLPRLVRLVHPYPAMPSPAISGELIQTPAR